MRIRVSLTEGETRPTNAKVLAGVARALGEPLAKAAPAKHDHEAEQSRFLAMRELGDQAEQIWDEEMASLLTQVQAVLAE